MQLRFMFVIELYHKQYGFTRYINTQDLLLSQERKKKKKKKTDTDLCNMPEPINTCKAFLFRICFRSALQRIQ